MIRACFADGVELPITCSHDIKPWNCIHASNGIARGDCEHWQPERAVSLARDILGATELACNVR